VPRRPWCKLREPTNLVGPTGRNPGHRVERRAPKPLSSALMTVRTLQEQASERLGPPKEDVGTKRRIECSRGSASKQISEFKNRTRRRLKRRGWDKNSAESRDGPVGCLQWSGVRRTATGPCAQFIQDPCWQFWRRVRSGWNESLQSLVCSRCGVDTGRRHGRAGARAAGGHHPRLDGRARHAGVLPGGKPGAGRGAAEPYPGGGGLRHPRGSGSRLLDRVVGLVSPPRHPGDRKSTRLNSSHVKISYAVFCLK